MVDPRIYRAGLALVAIAVIVFGFSLQPAPAPATTPMTPPAYAGPRLHALAGARTAAGSEARFATYVEGQLSGAVNVGGATGFDVAESSAEVQTATGMRSVPVVTASRTGVQAGTIVVVADRDAPGEAGVSGTAVLIGLAHALAGESQNHSIVLVSIGAPVGSAGATALARSLARAGQSIDAVLVLGDLAAAHPSEPVVVPFSDSETVAPPALTLTVARYLRAQTGIAAGGANFGAQLAHLAIPLTLTEQGPFAGRGMPAVLVSLAGSRLTAPGEAVNDGRPAEAYGAILETVDALDGAAPPPAPSAYLVLSGKVVPLWAVRLLVLALILPAGLATIDAFARTRRRGHSITRWLVWALAGAVPFIVVLAILELAHVAGLLPAPPALVGAGTVKLTASGAAVIAVAAIGWIAAFVLLRPLCIRVALNHLGHSAKRPSTAAGDAAAVALSVVMCVTALVVWALNPFAAALLIPAVNLWLWLAQEEVRARRWLVAALVLGGALPALAVLGYDAHSFGLMSPGQFAWSATLLVAGGGIPAAAAIYWSVVLGCLTSAVILGVRASRSAATHARVEPVVTVRGPIGYAGPGSLGGTKSALRR